jgi:hypothetical protein
MRGEHDPRRLGLRDAGRCERHSIANFNALAADDPGDYIFIYQGSAAYGDAVTLLNNQQLIGHGVGLTIAPESPATRPPRPLRRHSPAST